VSDGQSVCVVCNKERPNGQDCIFNVQLAQQCEARR
jgi:hypothetical protein